MHVLVRVDPTDGYIKSFKDLAEVNQHLMGAVCPFCAAQIEKFGQPPMHSICGKDYLLFAEHPGYESDTVPFKHDVAPA
jgi:hypothetical protein